MYVFQTSSLLDAVNRILMWFGTSARDSENCVNQNRKLTEKRCTRTTCRQPHFLQDRPHIHKVCLDEKQTHITVTR